MDISGSSKKILGQLCWHSSLTYQPKFTLGNQNGFFRAEAILAGLKNLLSSAQLLLQQHFPFPLSSLWFSGWA